MITREYIVALINGDYAILEDENKKTIDYLINYFNKK